MNRYIEESLELPISNKNYCEEEHLEDNDIDNYILDEKEDCEDKKIDEEIEKECLSKFNKLKESLEKINSNFLLEDNEINEIKKEALSAYKDMLEAGFVCESKYANNFLEPATQVLNIALNAEKIKNDKKIRFMKLKLQKEKLDLLRRKIELEEKKYGQNVSFEEGKILFDRNQLLEILTKDK